MKIKGLEIYGEPGQFAGSSNDDGTHAGFEVALPKFIESLQTEYRGA
ncbi:hypothetical protein [Pectobacterium betavasculorum]|nr:hypothetical protein [Pectobacterium betavasculorum]